MYKIRRHLFIITFLLICQIAQSQSVQLRTYENILRRVQSSTDTLYVVNFWATWCKPCIKELPYFENLAKKYSDQKIKVILVSLDFTSKMNTQVVPFIKNKYLYSEVCMLNEELNDASINAIDTRWSGAIPMTLIYYKGQKYFYEKEFVNDELENELKKIKK